MRRYNIALTNAQADYGILAELKKFRYDEARLKEGMALLNKTIELFAVQKKEFGEQIEASEAVNELTDKCKAAYNATLEIARTAFSSRIFTNNRPQFKDLFLIYMEILRNVISLLKNVNQKRVLIYRKM